MTIQEKCKNVLVDIVCIAAGALFVVLITVATNLKYNATVDSCTGSATAYLVNEYVDEYLYAPYHGGRVTTKYTTHLKYNVDIEDITYSFSLQLSGKRKTVEYLPVKYNPSNPSEFFYYVAELSATEFDREWMYHKATEDYEDNWLENNFGLDLSED